MASTSLAEQLKKLSVPQTAIYKEEKKKASLLFDPKEAALKDRDTFYEIGISGLKELIALYDGFRFYEDTLFSHSSKDFERAVQSKEVNQNLDHSIEKFLLQLSPYLLLQSSHKALEWLINRYQIHLYNQDAIMALILPYHETMIFVRFVQILDIKHFKNKWNWLQSIQKSGSPMPKQMLYNQCVSNPAMLKIISQNTLKCVTEFGERATQLNTVFVFFCATAIGTIHQKKRADEPIMNGLLPTVMVALESPIQDFRATAYVILGYLSSKADIKTKTLDDIVEKLLNSEFDLTYEATLLINLFYIHQTRIPLLDSLVCNLSPPIMANLCEHLKKLIDNKINVHPFVKTILTSILKEVQEDAEKFRMYCNMPEMLIDQVDLSLQQPEKIIKCILYSYKSKKNAENVDDDIEIIDEEDFSFKILNWYSLLLKSVERKYPDAFDKVVKEEMSSKDPKSAEKRAIFSEVLGFKPSVAHKVGDTYLFENLNHVNPELRVEAVKYIGKEFETLKKDNLDFVKESLLNRLHDDSPSVVMAALEISSKNLNELFNEAELTDAFVTIMSRGTKPWMPVVSEAISKFCSLNVLPVNQATILALTPYLFPYDKKSASRTWRILTSPWGQKFELTKKLNLNKSFKDNYEVLSQIVFKTLFIDRAVNFDYLESFQINKNSALDISMFLLLKSCKFEETPVEELTEILNLLLESVENREIVPSVDEKPFDNHIMNEFINVAQKDRFLFEVMEYIFSRIIEGMNIKNITKPWCNVCKDTETVLVRRLFEICVTGCAIQSYAENYSKLLKKILDKLFKNTKERFEFIANFACGHILYATDPKDVISPELQLRCLKLLNHFISMQDKANWLYESDVLILMILFNLNNPINLIREYTITIMEQLLNENPNKSLPYVQLLKELLEHKEELLLDHNQIMQILNTVLTQQTAGNKVFRKNCLTKLIDVLTKDTPAHICSELLKILSNVNNTQAFSMIIQTLKKYEPILKENQDDPKFSFDIYESKVIQNICGRINESTISTVDKQPILDTISFLLKVYKQCVLLEDQTFTSPAVLVMKQINEEVFKKVPEEQCKALVKLFTCAGAFSNDPIIASASSKVMRKIHVQFADFKSILEGMLNADDKTPRKKNKTVTMLSYELTETNEWRLGVTLLEYVQNKKKMTVDNSFVSLLFQLLKKCLRFEEQSYVEYTKQLILSELWYYCKKFVDEKDKEQIKQLKSIFDIELVVQCIRGTQNPQTHHHALILLSHAAYMLPEQVLHHTMEIFTFIGSSVLRHDDAYSFQIIIKIIETLIPILVKLDMNIEDYTDKELQQLQKRVVPVLRIFADVVLHVPEHRRLPLYKKLLETLGPNQFLWIFLALLLETHVRHFKDGKEGKDTSASKTLADKESPVNRLDFGQSILLEFPPETCLDNLIKLMVYVKSLPMQKDENSMDTDIDPSEIFSVNGHSPLQLRHFKYAIITFMNTCLASSRFIHHSSQATEIKTMEGHYKTFIINILTFIQSISKISDEKTAKYWRVMLHHSYDLLDHTNSLLSAPMFLSVVRGLLKHTLQTVRRKAMELLNNKIQYSPEMFTGIDNELLYSLLPALLDIVKTIDANIDDPSKPAAQELELNQQTALLSLKLLARMLAAQDPTPFKPVLETVTEYTCNPNISGNVMASVVLCLAELCGNLKAHSLASLRKFMPALIKVLKKQRKAETPELVLLSTVTALSKIVESLPLFLSPYLLKILYEYAILLAKWQAYDQDCSKVSAIITKLGIVKKKIAGSIPPRVLIPVANATHQLLLDKEKYDSIGAVMSVLAESFANVTSADFTALQQDLTAFFLSALQLRSDAAEKNADAAVIDSAEDEIVNALVSLVLKLSETSFRPFYFKIYDWAIRTNVEGQKERAITFYRVSSAIADKLKGLFVLFAGHFIKNAAELLDSCNASKTEELYYDSDEKCISLVKYIIKTLHIVFLYDSQNFLNKSRFETLMQPVVDQLENHLGGVLSLKDRAVESLIPCIAQFAVATADDSLWKLLNYQILLKTRHNDAEIRLLALECLVAMATQLGSSWLPLLAESVPFLAELLEDGDSKIEASTKEAIRKLETILGEPLEKYF